MLPLWDAADIQGWDETCHWLYKLFHYSTLTAVPSVHSVPEEAKVKENAAVHFSTML